MLVSNHRVKADDSTAGIAAWLYHLTNPYVLGVSVPSSAISLSLNWSSITETLFSTPSMRWWVDSKAAPTEGTSFKVVSTVETLVSNPSIAPLLVSTLVVNAPTPKSSFFSIAVILFPKEVFVLSMLFWRVVSAAANSERIAASSAAKSSLNCASTSSRASFVNAIAFSNLLKPISKLSVAKISPVAVVFP